VLAAVVFHATAAVAQSSTSPAAAATATNAESLLVRILDARVGQLAALLQEESPRQAAAWSLLSLHDAFAVALLSQCESASPEARARIADTLAQCARLTREELVLADFSPAQREKLLEFRRLHPRLFVEAVSEDLDRRAAAVAGLMKIHDPNQLAEPLLAMALRSPHEATQRAALNVVAKKRYVSDGLIDAVTDLVIASGSNDNRPEFREMRGGGRSLPRLHNNDEANAIEQACRLLRIWKPARALPTLMGSLQNASRAGNTHVLDLLVDIGDRRCVPLTMKLLTSASTQGGDIYDGLYTDDGRLITRTHADGLLYLLLRLTNQSPAAYNMEPMPHGYSGYDISRNAYGFEKKSDRTKAITKAKQWYANNKNRYKTVPTMTLPPQPERASPPPWPGKPAATDAASPHADLLDVADLCEEISRTVAKISDDLDARTPAARTRAQQRLIALHGHLTAPLLQTQAGRETRLPHNMAALCEGLAHAASLDKSSRDKLLGFRARNDEIFRQFFHLEWAAQTEALKRLIHRDDATGAGEAIVILGLASRSPAVREFACQAAATGRYHSDRVIDLLSDMLTHNNVSFSSPTVLGALEKIGSPRTSHLLLGRMTRNTIHQADAYAAALIASRDLRLVPALTEQLGQNRGIARQHTTAGKTIGTCLNDYHLYILLKLTGQSPTDYDMFDPALETDEQRQYLSVGFADDKARSAAYKKMLMWWAEHAGKPPYKNLEPLPAVAPDPARLPGIEDSGWPDGVILRGDVW